MNARYFSLAVGCLLGFVSDAQPPGRAELQLLSKKLSQHHVSPRPIDDDFAQFVVNYLTDELDPEKKFFIKPEILQLKKYETLIDDEIREDQWTFIPALVSLYRRALLRSEKIVQEIAPEKIQYVPGSTYTNPESWCDSEELLRERWRKELRLETLRHLQRKWNNTATGKFADLEKNAQLKAMHSLLHEIRQKLNHSVGLDQYVTNKYFNAITHAYDAHSDYFSVSEIANFLSLVSTEGYFFGFTLEEDIHGEVIITHIVPGGPTWNSGKIHSGDFLEGMKWESGEWIASSESDMDELNQMLVDHIDQKLFMAIRNPAGKKDTVTLKREKIEQEQGVVKSFLLKGDRTIGYISLPGFYSDFGTPDGAHCAVDVAKEILLMKKENVSGIMLDLRRNGGGSRDEAVAMAGIFIDAGPVEILQTRGGELTTIKDINRGTVYDGPLVVMVDGFSASASELLAAALQDYRRAIIVGSKTYGKATEQQIFPLDPAPQSASGELSNKSTWGYAKITIGKWYRLNGRSLQGRGVTPDIAIPGMVDLIAPKELDNVNVMQRDSVQKKTYYEPLPLLPIKELKEKSEKRIAGNVTFAQMHDSQKAYLKWVNAPVPLGWNEFKNYYMQFNAVVQNPPVKNISAFQAEPTHVDKRTEISPYYKELQEGWLSALSSDPALEEAFHITNDYIEVLNRKN